MNVTPAQVVIRQPLHSEQSRRRVQFKDFWFPACAGVTNRDTAKLAVITFYNISEAQHQFQSEAVKKLVLKRKSGRQSHSEITFSKGYIDPPAA